LSVYGYSKSFKILNEIADQVPRNYVLNLSSGHNADIETVVSIEQKPFVRGHFIAVDKAETIEDKKAYETKTGRKAFICPGKCGECLPSGTHACGQLAIRKDIIISMH
jgi:hypothetical protein